MVACERAAAYPRRVRRLVLIDPIGFWRDTDPIVNWVKLSPADLPNKAVVYDLLFRAAAETLLTIAADPRHLGARIGFSAVLHSWGSAMTHHPHLHYQVL